MEQKFLTYAGKKHIAGLEPEDALEVCRLFTRRGCLGTISPWLSGRESREEVFQIYSKALEMLGKEMLPCQLSVKPVNFDYDYGFFKDILDVASEYRIALQVDSFDIASAERTFALIEQGTSAYPLIGCTLPARWARSMADAIRVVEMQIPVRVVIGQWVDKAVPRTDYGYDFLKLVDWLSGRAARISIATHNRSLAIAALRRVRQTNTPHEIEQLVGMPFVAPLGVRIPKPSVRVYVPYGHPYLPYNISDLWSRPRVIGFALRDVFVSRNARLRKLRLALTDQHREESQFATVRQEVSSI